MKKKKLNKFKPQHHFKDCPKKVRIRKKKLCFFLNKGLCRKEILCISCEMTGQRNQHWALQSRLHSMFSKHGPESVLHSPLGHLVRLCLLTVMVTVLVHSGCFNTTPSTGWLRKQQACTSHGSGGWESEIRCEHGRVLVRALYWVAGCWFLLVSHTAEQRKEAKSIRTLIRALIPSTRAPSLRRHQILINSQRP